MRRDHDVLNDPVLTQLIHLGLHQRLVDQRNRLEYKRLSVFCKGKVFFISNRLL